MDIKRTPGNLVSFVPSMSSLRDIAVASLVGSAWKSSEFQESIRTHYRALHTKQENEPTLQDRERCFREIKNRVLDKLDGLAPGLYEREKASKFTRAMGLQLFRWMHIVEKHYGGLYNSTIAVELCLRWTMRGTLDKRKTLESLLMEFRDVKNALDLCNMAAFYCCGDLILKLVHEMPFMTEMEEILAPSRERSYSQLILGWNLLSELSKFHRTDYRHVRRQYENMMLLSITCGNAAAVRFLWDLFPQELRTEKLLSSAYLAIKLGGKKEHLVFHGTSEFTDIMCFFLSQMNAEQQMQVFKDRAFMILSMLANDWPWEEFLVPTIRLLWDDLTVEECDSILSVFIQQLGNGATEMFRRLWLDTPVHLKRELLVSFSIDPTRKLYEFFDADDFKSLRLILSDCDDKERERVPFNLVNFHDDGARLFVDIFPERLPFLETLLKETLPTESKVVEFKRHLVTELGDYLCCDWINDGNSESFEAFKNWCFTSEQEFKEFKRNVKNKLEMMTQMVRRGSYERVENYLEWCFGSDVEKMLPDFKKEFRENEENLDTLFVDGCWDLFQQFLNWSCDSDEDIVAFKKVAFPSPEDDVFLNDQTEFGQNLRRWYFEEAME